MIGWFRATALLFAAFFCATFWFETLRLARELLT